MALDIIRVTLRSGMCVLLLMSSAKVEGFAPSTHTSRRHTPVTVNTHAYVSNQPAALSLSSRNGITAVCSSLNGNNINDNVDFFSSASPPEDKESRNQKHFLETSQFVLTPFIASFVSFFLYPTTSRMFHNTAQFLSSNNWVPVDGGQLQWSILLPALNGVVMTAISLLYANLISTTGTQLRNRQINIQTSLMSEVDGIRGLAQLLEFYPSDARSQCGAHLMVYIKMLVLELSPESAEFSLRSTIPPLSEYRNTLHRVSIRDEIGDGQTIHGNILERSYEMLDRVSSGRSSRITSLQTTFPLLHYMTISFLTAAILFVFLIETDRPVILFLDNFQLRLVWSLLVWTLTAIFCIGIDLNSPFVGTYTVPADDFLNEADDLLSLIKDTFSTVDRAPAASYATTSSKSSDQTVQSPLSPPIPPQQATVQTQAPPMQPSVQQMPSAPTSNLINGGTVNEESSANDNLDTANGRQATQVESFEDYMRKRSRGEYN